MAWIPINLMVTDSPSGGGRWGFWLRVRVELHPGRAPVLPWSHTFESKQASALWLTPGDSFRFSHSTWCCVAGSGCAVGKAHRLICTMTLNVTCATWRYCTSCGIYYVLRESSVSVCDWIHSARCNTGKSFSQSLNFSCISNFEKKFALRHCVGANLINSKMSKNCVKYWNLVP